MMKYLKGAVILSVGVIGGFAACGVVVVNSIVKSDTLRTALVNAISAKIETLIYGEKNPKYHKESYRNYNDIRIHNRQNDVKRRSGRYPWGLEKEQGNNIRLQEYIIFDTREDAEKTVDAMKDVINQYGRATVADLYDLSGLTSTFKDNQYGWTNISGINIVSDIIQGKDGYTIQFPQALLLK